MFNSIVSQDNISQRVDIFFSRINFMLKLTYTIDNGIEIKCILERKEYRFSLERNKPKITWVSDILVNIDNSILIIWWVSVGKSILSE